MSAESYLEAASLLTIRDGTDPWTALMRVLLEELQAVEIPAELTPFLGGADRYWNAGEGDLMPAKEAVWEYLRREFSPGNDLAAPDGRAARALLCVLGPEGGDEARSMTAEWFAAMVGNAS